MTSSALFQVNNQHTIPNTNNDKFKFFIAIDFGTDGACLAYADEEKTYIHEQFESIKYGRTVKPKTIILLNEKGEFQSFGKNAKRTLCTSYSLDISPFLSCLILYRYMAFKSSKKSKWMLFDRFKMSLYGMSYTIKNYKHDIAYFLGPVIA